MTRTYKLLGYVLVLLFLSHRTAAQYSMYERNAIARAEYRAWLQYQKAKASGENLKKFWKSESTIGLAFSGPLNYTERSKYDSVAHISQRSYDSVIKGAAKSQLSFSINGNSNHMLARLSANSILSFSWGVQANVLRWEFQTFDGNQLKTTKENLLYAQLGIPLTIDYKWGCDVDFDPELKACFAVGAGAMPMAGMSLSGFETSSMNGRLTPYLYASFGFYARGCWKIRLSYQPGNYTIFKDASVNHAGTINTLNMQGSNVITIGISHMQHSGDWGKYNAWRGSNRNGGGGRRRHVYENSRMF